MTAHDDRRRAQRRGCALPIELSSGKDMQGLKCETTDVSLYGCYVALRSTFPKDAMLDVVLWAGETRISVRGKVVTADPNVGNGIEFTDMSAGSRHQLAQYLEQIEAPAADSGFVVP